MSDKKHSKYVILDISTPLYQEDINKLIEHMKKLDGFFFMVKSAVYAVKEVEEQGDKQWLSRADVFDYSKYFNYV